MTKIRIVEFHGRTRRLSTSRRRNWPIIRSSVGTMYESKSKLSKSAYSYDQYHWWPTALIDIVSFFISLALMRVSNS